MRAGPQEGAKPDWTGSRSCTRPSFATASVRETTATVGTPRTTFQASDSTRRRPACCRRSLRNATDAKDVPTGDAKVDQAATRTLEATAKAADIPGIVAADGDAFTELTDELAYGFDDAGRLVSVNASALNTNMTDFDLVIETVIRSPMTTSIRFPKPSRP